MWWSATPVSDTAKMDIADVDTALKLNQKPTVYGKAVLGSGIAALLRY
jgi:hypothetical protein